MVYVIIRRKLGRALLPQLRGDGEDSSLCGRVSCTAAEFETGEGSTATSRGSRCAYGDLPDRLGGGKLWLRLRAVWREAVQCAQI
jgi:hypothetical protein